MEFNRMRPLQVVDTLMSGNTRFVGGAVFGENLLSVGAKYE